jgi:hypothetical protein
MERGQILTLFRWTEGNLLMSDVPLNRLPRDTKLVFSLLTMDRAGAPPARPARQAHPAGFSTSAPIGAGTPPRRLYVDPLPPPLSLPAGSSP